MLGFETVIKFFGNPRAINFDCIIQSVMEIFIESDIPFVDIGEHKCLC